MKKSIVAITTVLGLFAGSAVAAGTGDLWGNTYADYKNKESVETTIVGVEGGWSNTQGGAWAGIEQNVTDDIQWVGVGGDYRIHGDLSVFASTEFERGEDEYSWSMYKGGLSYSGINGDGWSVTPSVGYKAEAGHDHVVGDWSDSYAVMGVSANYQVAPQVVLFASVDGSAMEDFKTEMDVGLTYNIPNIPGAYVKATYEYDIVGSESYDGFKLRAGYQF